MKKMKRLVWVVGAFLLAASPIIVPSLDSSAATGNQDGIEAEFVLDKAEYEPEDSITGTVTLKNTNNFAVNNVSVESNNPSQKLILSAGSLNESKATLGGGETLRLDFTLSPQDDLQETPQDNGSGENLEAPGAGGGVIFNEGAEGFVRSQWMVVVLVVAGIGAAAAFILRKKMGKASKCLVIAGMIVSGVISGFGMMSVEAAELKGFSLDEVANYSDGESLDFRVVIKYELEEEEVTEGTITLNANGGIGGPVELTGEIGSKQALLPPFIYGITRINYVDLRWDTEPDGSGVGYDFMSEIEIKGDLDLYVIWREAN